MLPQGIFSVAVTTVLFPTLARFAARSELDDLRATMANGMRQILLLLVPATAAILVLSEPMVELVYERGAFGERSTELVAEALFWFAFSLPFNGLFLLLTRTFFSLQRPWLPTAIAAVNLAVTALFCGALLRAVRGRRHRRRDRDRDRGQRRAQTYVLRAPARPPRARPADRGRRLAICSPGRRSPASRYGVWRLLDDGLGDALVAQIVSLGFGLGVGAAVYAAAVTFMRIPEATQIWRLLRRSPRSQ